MAQQTITNGELGATVRAALNAMFTELYGSIVVPLKVPGLTANYEQQIPADGYLSTILIGFVSGAPTLAIGTTPGAGDIFPATLISGFNQALVQEYYAANTPLYITITGTGIINLTFLITPNVF